MEQYFIDAMKAIYAWFIATLQELIQTMLAPVEPYVPDLSSFWHQADTLASYLGWANSWIALDWGGMYLGMYGSFIIAMISIKLFVKLLIPGEG